MDISYCRIVWYLVMSFIRCVSKKVPTFELPICQNLADFHNVLKFVTKPIDIMHLTLGMLLHYLGKFKIEIFCSYTADMEENV